MANPPYFLPDKSLLPGTYLFSSFVFAVAFASGGFSELEFVRRMAFSFSRRTFSRSSVADNREMGFGRGLLFLV